MADDDKDSDRKKLDALILLFLAGLIGQSDLYIAGKIAASELPAALLPIIAEYHAQAGMLGRQAAGDSSARDNGDDLFGHAQAAKDAPYLQNFAGQLALGWGRETVSDANGNPIAGPGSLNPEAAPMKEGVMERRLALYAERLHGSAHEAFVMASPADSEYIWHLSSDKPCDDCVELAAGSPYNAITLPTYPGIGATACGTNCKCWLERNDGLAPFAGE